MTSSPRPVEPAAPVSLSTYSPQPIKGESPTRPGIFQASPLVVVTPLMSKFLSSARQLIVPVGGFKATSSAHASSSATELKLLPLYFSASWKLARLRSSASRRSPDGEAGAGVYGLGPHLSSFDRFSFQRSQAMRDSSVSSSTFSKPVAVANSRAPAPTMRM